MQIESIQFRPRTPDAYTPKSVRESIDALGEAIIVHVERIGHDNARHAVRKHYPNAKGKYLRQVLGGEFEALGIKRLFGLAECLGLNPREIIGSYRPDRSGGF
jgi:hypothetical protein